MIMNGMDKVNQEVFIKDKKHHDKSAGRESRQSRFARQPVMSGGAMIDTTRRECQSLCPDQAAHLRSFPAGQGHQERPHRVALAVRQLYSRAVHWS
jgi:hypothetical protein